MKPNAALFTFMFSAQTLLILKGAAELCVSVKRKVSFTLLLGLH